MLYTILLLIWQIRKNKRSNCWLWGTVVLERQACWCDTARINFTLISWALWESISKLRKLKHKLIWSPSISGILLARRGFVILPRISTREHMESSWFTRLLMRGALSIFKVGSSKSKITAVPQPIWSLWGLNWIWSMIGKYPRRMVRLLHMEWGLTSLNHQPKKTKISQKYSRS